MVPRLDIVCEDEEPDSINFNLLGWFWFSFLIVDKQTNEWTFQVSTAVYVYSTNGLSIFIHLFESRTICSWRELKNNLKRKLLKTLEIIKDDFSNPLRVHCWWWKRGNSFECIIQFPIFNLRFNWKLRLKILLLVDELFYVVLVAYSPHEFPLFSFHCDDFYF